jgi:hypothetical protein
MTSYLIDFVLLAALVFTSWRAGRMHREILALKRDERELAEMLASADRSINEAAHSVVVLKGEGLETARVLAGVTAEAKDAADRLSTLVERADWHAGAAHQGRNAA